ncbi:UNVERIFIED_CONTAM: cytochrome [Sesamum calycinum]|uniref:Cytochrome n=1 Tax=Sesamum calycinum TaxID=2727403 RepID=A0AAW2P7F1_9LAMI
MNPLLTLQQQEIVKIVAEMELTLYCIILLVFLLTLRHFLVKQQRNNRPPSPPALPLIGHLHLVKEPLNQTLQALSAKYGDILSLRLGVRKVLVVTSPAAVEECFTKNDVIFANRPSTLSTKHFSYNYTTISIAPYGDHGTRRLAALEIFSPARIAMFTATRRRELTLVLNELLRDAEAGGGSTKVDLKSKFIELAFNVLSMTIAGKRYYGENVADAEEARRGLEEFAALMEKLDKFMQELVNERREFMLKSGFYGGNGGHSEKTMIDHLLSLQENEPEYYTDELIKGIILVLLVAGTDTMSISMEWAMSLLLNHPEAIEKIKAEIDANVPADRLLDEQDLPKLSYLQNGTMLLVNLWAIQRDPRLWDEPTKFMPERHETTNGEGFMLPFGAGRRKCPGGGIASRVLGLTLGTMIQLFEWRELAMNWWT